jgi:hypothetical protein
MDLDKVKANIRAMLNLANDSAATQGEIDNAMRFVNKLMAQHQLKDEDLSEVDDKLLQLERAEMNHEWAYYNGHKVSEWEGIVATFCCSLVGGVKNYYTSNVPYKVDGVLQHFFDGKPMTKPTIVFYGLEEDVEIARMLFVELTTTIATMGKLKWGGIFRGEGREYCTGFAQGLYSQLQRDNAEQLMLAREGDTKTTKSTAMVAIENRGMIVKKKQDLAIKYRKEKLGIDKLRSGGNFASGRDFSADARNEGRNDGKSHSVSAERRRKLSGPGGK